VRIKELKQVLGGVGSSNRFKLKDGKRLGSLEELYDACKDMKDHVFEHHTSEKNHFSNWVKDVFNDHKLASNISEAKDKHHMADIIRKRIDIVKSIVGRHSNKSNMLEQRALRRKQRAMENIKERAEKKKLEEEKTKKMETRALRRKAKALNKIKLARQRERVEQKKINRIERKALQRKERAMRKIERTLQPSLEDALKKIPSGGRERVKKKKEKVVKLEKIVKKKKVKAKKRILKKASAPKNVRTLHKAVDQKPKIVEKKVIRTNVVPKVEKEEQNIIQDFMKVDVAMPFKKAEAAIEECVKKHSGVKKSFNEVLHKLDAFFKPRNWQKIEDAKRGYKIVHKCPHRTRAHCRIMEFAFGFIIGMLAWLLVSQVV